MRKIEEEEEGESVLARATHVKRVHLFFLKGMFDYLHLLFLIIHIALFPSRRFHY